MSATVRAAPDDLVRAIEAIPDPELPVVSIQDLGILRKVALDEAAGQVVVTVTPTYSGCPAMAAITDRVVHVSRKNGWQPTVLTRLSPAWTTDWMSDEGREKLRRSGVAPPADRHTVGVGDGAGTAGAAGAAGAAGSAVPVELARRVVACPQCASTDTRELAHFGSTACKALRRCQSCGEPFDEFKAI